MNIIDKAVMDTIQASMCKILLAKLFGLALEYSDEIGTVRIHHFGGKQYITKFTKKEKNNE